MVTAMEPSDNGWKLTVESNGQTGFLFVRTVSPSFQMPENYLCVSNKHIVLPSGKIEALAWPSMRPEQSYPVFQRGLLLKKALEEHIDKNELPNGTRFASQFDFDRWCYKNQEGDGTIDANAEVYRAVINQSN